MVRRHVVDCAVSDVFSAVEELKEIGDGLLD